MESVIEQSVFNNTRCYTCGALVYAVEKKMTSNHIYHSRCFRCRICKRNLTGSTLNEEGDDIYCENCYRKKQRGECDTLDFKRAAAERAQYVYNRRHPDQSVPTGNPQPPVRRDFARNPSWSLRQLERKYLSLQPSLMQNPEKAADTNKRFTTSVTHPLTIKTSFSSPINFAKFRFDSIRDQRSPSLHFSPVFSPYPSARANTPKATSERQAKTDSYSLSTKSVDAVGRRFDRSFSSPLTQRFTSIDRATPSIVQRSTSNDRGTPSIGGLNQKNDLKSLKESKFRFPDVDLAALKRRSFSANRLNFARRFK